ncbi:cytochrome b/b6 domain-containing protein [Thiomicrorhabdus sp. ZW0627]|uniref:cytochrome b/b6 domain-containing protein n=1 Tax=Thiomicrorhabdus sp. ZW0627 TaxID=3039774 RepID=UPI0024369F89|nr:cytochrome b/b6 domain-containing protein [Thiomicrorhabdus sp. ZW0627]MDG6772744.1 cytochrome b/b6 domain-containing protein [Thiomicrorhabdus sp. ZW0627]
MHSANQIKVWDIAVRIFHWSLVLLFFTSYLTGDDESTIHVYSGYGIIGLLVFRILWGLVGTKYARFSNFIYGKEATIEYAKSMATLKPKRYLGHNPLGGWMIIALIISLIATTWSGLSVYGSKGHGPLAGNFDIVISSAMADDDEHEHESGEGDEFMEEIHEFFANFTLFLVFVHIGGVLISSLIHRENLVRSMVTGLKDKDDT